MYTTYQGDPNSDKVYIVNKDRRLEEKIVKIIRESGGVKYWIERSVKDYLELNAPRILDRYIRDYLNNQQHFSNQSINYNQQMITDSVMNEIKKAFPKDMKLSIK